MKMKIQAKEKKKLEKLIHIRLHDENSLFDNQVPITK